MHTHAQRLRKTANICCDQSENRKDLFFSTALTALSGPGPLLCRNFTITLSHTTLGRAPLEERSALRIDLYLTTHNTQKKETSMPHCGIRTRNPSKRAAADSRLRPHSYWDRRKNSYGKQITHSNGTG